ncbi:MAG: bifunctional DNA-formamidopyrimidine glycosylase/DNA-(apurinic or apyrimidinic site) lyase [Mariprofundales bacterium]|nr:bifunctional DNA-formamidopyrimidine glycosylase/DNA-(apurinic or apyrimidinic site) lyase [Mariprofundales bacterium]
MPELPEVETVKRGLEPVILNRTIVRANCSGKRLRLPWPPHLCARLIGQRILAVERRAKYLLTPLSGAETIIWHLGMSGCLRLLEKDSATPKHQHLLLTLDHDLHLSFADPRRFGLIDLCPTAQLSQHRCLAALGPEPLSEAFDADYLRQQLAKRRSPIKSMLLNSRLVAGIGNIYANEALFDAEISPFLPASKLNRTQCECLVAAIRSVLTRAIDAGGSTINDFIGSDGQPGYFAHQFHCYGKTKSPCPRCQTPIIQSKQHGRSSFYCPRCQPAE